MNSIYIDAKLDESTRRDCIYNGEIFFISPTKSSLELCAFAAELSRVAFNGLDPVTAYQAMPVEKYVEILASLKPTFIHHPESKRLIKNILVETGHDLQKTYFDVPRLRTAAPSDYLRYGIAYAFHPHRDTWYSAPQNQINWWMPVFEMQSGNSMAFHPYYWKNPLANSSHIYNYQNWNATMRANAAENIKSDSRPQPQATETVVMEPQTRIICPVGGMILFSGAQLHSTVPNQTSETRFSIDFRIVNEEDVKLGRGAPNIDSACTGTALGDFLRGTDLEKLPQTLIEKFL